LRRVARLERSESRDIIASRQPRISLSLNPGYGITQAARRCRGPLDDREDTPVVQRDEETRAAVLEGLAQAKRGEFVAHEAVAAPDKRNRSCAEV
jgi:hypothetical protein